MSLNESQFQTIADTYLAELFDTLDELIGDVADVDLEDGILTIEMDEGGSFVINKHAPNCQIWLASPKSGASHYDYDETSKGWTGTRGQGDLSTLLSTEFQSLTGKTISL